MKWSTLPRGSQSSFFLCCTVVLYLAVLRVSAQDLEYYVLQCCWRYSRNSYSYSSPASLSLFRCCVLFTHLAMVHGLQGNNIHFSAAATLCQQALSADSSTFRLTITRHKSRISCLCSCDNNFMLGKQINGKRKK